MLAESHAMRQRAAAAEGPVYPEYATIVSRDDAGVVLMLPSGEVTKKKHCYNRSVSFRAGNKVKLGRVSGNYIAEYIIGV